MTVTVNPIEKILQKEEGMNVISCPKCKNKWDKDELVDYVIDSGIAGNRHTPHMNGDIKIQDLIFCPICFFSTNKDYKAKLDRVVLIEDRIKIKSIVVEDEFGRYIDMDVNDFKKLKISIFNPHGDDDVDDHTSVWGGAGPDCINGRLEAAQ